MTEQGAQRKIGRRLMTRQFSVFALLAASIALCVGVVVLLDGMRASGARAEEQSTSAMNAGYDYTLQVSHPDGIEALTKAPIPRLTTTIGEIATQDSLGSVTIVASTEAEVVETYGLDVRGSEARGTAAVAVSEAVARDYEASIGDTVEVSTDDWSTTAEVGRVFVIPSEPDARFVIVAAPVEAGPTGSTRWLLNDVDFSDPELNESLDQLGSEYFEVRSSTGLAQEKVDVLESGRFMALTFVGPAGLLVATAAWVAVLILVRPRLTRHITAFTALGLTAGQAMSVVRRACATTAVLGVLAGAAIGQLGLLLLYRTLGRVVDQAWQVGAVSLLRTSLFLVATVLAILVATELTIRNRTRFAAQRRVPNRRQRLRSAAVAASVGLVSWVAGVTDVINPYYAAVIVGLATVVAASGASLLISDAVARRGPSNLLVGAKRASASGWIIGLVVGVITLSGTLLSGMVNNALHTEQKAYIPDQPPMSIVAYEVGDETSRLVTSAWRSATPQQPSEPWALPIARSGANDRLFASSPEFVECAEGQGGINNDARCPVPERITVNPTDVALGDAPRGGVLADPDLIVDGNVGLLRTTSDGQVVGSWIVPAQGMQALGNFLPGVVVDPESKIAADLDIAPVGNKQIVLDGSALAEDELTRIGASIAGSTPATRVVVETGYDDGGLTEFMAFVSLGAALLVGVMVVVLGAGLIRSSQPFCTLVDSLGATRSTRWRVASAMLVEPFVVLLAVPVGIAVAMPLWDSAPVDWASPVTPLPIIVGAAGLFWVLVRLALGPSRNAQRR
ncbi:MAG: hypothetical protein ACTMIR_06290 [Cellulomonadaceae bacterium]